MRVAVVDIGSNSTRLLVADVGEDGVEELDRRSIVTRLGEGVDATGRLGEEPQARVFAALERPSTAPAPAGSPGGSMRQMRRTFAVSGRSRRPAP